MMRSFLFVDAGFMTNYEEDFIGTRQINKIRRNDGGKHTMDNEGIIDQAEIDELLAVANKELLAPEIEPAKLADSAANQLLTSQDNKVSIWSQIKQQQHIKQIVTTVILLFILTMVSGGFLGYKREQQILTAPLPLEKIIQMGITFEVKNLVAYAERGDKDIVTAFLSAGMDINSQRSTDGWTALTAATFYKKPAIVQLLIEHHAAINIQDLYGRTPLMYAAAMGTEEIVNLLLEAGADPNIQDKKGRTALMEAYSKQEAKIAEILKSAGANTTLSPATKLEESSTAPSKTISKENLTPPASTIPEEIRLSIGRAGLIKIGMSIEELQELYPSLTLREEYIDGRKRTTATIYSQNSANPSLKVELSSGKIQLVSLINIYDSTLMTDKNITLNSTVGDIRNQYSVSEVRVIDNSLFLVIKSMRMLFELDMRNAEIPIEWLKNGNVNSIPSTTKVIRMVMY